MEMTDEQLRALFRTMHEDKAPTKRLASANRSNEAEPFSGDGFLEKFDEMLDEQLSVAEGVYKSFGLSE